LRPQRVKAETGAVALEIRSTVAVSLDQLN
jgi:hypothetical protein